MSKSAPVSSSETEFSQLSVSKMGGLVLQAAGEGIFGDGITRFSNSAAADMLGWTVEELLGQSGHELLHHLSQMA